MKKAFVLCLGAIVLLFAIATVSCGARQEITQAAMTAELWTITAADPAPQLGRSVDAWMTAMEKQTSQDYTSTVPMAFAAEKGSQLAIMTQQATTTRTDKQIELKDAAYYYATALQAVKKEPKGTQGGSFAHVARDAIPCPAGYSWALAYGIEMSKDTPARPTTVAQLATRSDDFSAQFVT